MSQGTTHESDRPAPAAALRLGRFVFKPATTPDEFEQLHRLNHATFVREVPQHADRGDGRLVDKFHDRNLYFVALQDGVVVGMFAVHDRPPFSVADKLADPSVLARLGPRPLEVRLLAIEPRHRHGAVFAGLGLAVLRHAQRRRYSHLLISGVAERLGMYERLGFRALGPPSRHGAASFVPMVAPVAELPASVLDDLRRIEAKVEASPPRALLSLTPGHSQLPPAVLAALAQPGIDHRSDEFAALHALVLARLATLTGGIVPALFCGSGTLCNDVVAATLAADRRTRRGLVLVNGEFGRRLSAQAARFGLRHDTLAFDWGSPWDRAALERALESHDAPDWVWAVHLESSTGMLNDVAMLRDAARRRGVRVCLDCISSLGAVPLDLAGVHLATGVGNKAIGGVAGLGLVVAAPGALDGVDSARVPTYLDLRATLAAHGPRFTLSSNVLRALAAALEPYADELSRRRRFQDGAQLGRFVRAQLRRVGLPPLVAEEHGSPLITTFAPATRAAADELLARGRAQGFGLGGGSAYLRERGWLQLATMGDVTLADAERLFTSLFL